MWPSFINSISFSGDRVHPWLQSINGLLTMVVDHRSKSWDHQIQKKITRRKIHHRFRGLTGITHCLVTFPIYQRPSPPSAMVYCVCLRDLTRNAGDFSTMRTWRSYKSWRSQTGLLLRILDAFCWLLGDKKRIFELSRGWVFIRVQPIKRICQCVCVRVSNSCLTQKNYEWNDLCSPFCYIDMSTMIDTCYITIVHAISTIVHFLFQQCWCTTTVLITRSRLYMNHHPMSRSPSGKNQGQSSHHSGSWRDPSYVCVYIYIYS